MPIQSNEYQIPSEHVEPNLIHARENDIDPDLIADIEKVYSDMPESQAFVKENITDAPPSATDVYEFLPLTDMTRETYPMLRTGNLFTIARKYELDTNFFDRDESKLDIVKVALKSMFSTGNSKQVNTRSRGKYRDLTEERLINKEDVEGATIFGTDLENMKVLGFHVEGTENREWYLHFQQPFEGRTVNVIWHYSILNDRVLKATTIEDPKSPESNKVEFKIADPADVKNLGISTEAYAKKILPKIYNRDPNTGRLLDQLI